MRAPLDRVIVVRPKPVKESSGGVVLPESSERRVFHGRVVAVGPTVETACVGDVVVFEAGGDTVDWGQLGSYHQRMGDRIVSLTEGMIHFALEDEEVEAIGLDVPTLEDAQELFRGAARYAT